MKLNDVDVYICPYSGGKLTLNVDKEEGDEILEGSLVNDEGTKFNIADGLPDLIWPKELGKVDEKTKLLYTELADEYDKYANIPFETFKISNDVVRENITERLKLTPSSVVLEIGGGDGRGAEFIAKKLGKTGYLYFQELSDAFLKKAKIRLSPFQDNVSFSVANASYLSFEDNFFDCAHHFGGISTFDNVENCLKELVRVVKPGGKVVIGDESMAPWLKNTKLGKIMMNSNHLFNYEIPLSILPVDVRNVKVEWIMMGAYFLLEFEVGEGEQEPNYFVPIPSKRGGNHWVRYNGHLEGVTDNTKIIAYEAQQKSGKSMHDWLEDTVKAAALIELDKKR